jgi:hypothetical protein
MIMVVGFLIVFLLRNPPETAVVDEENPQAFVEACIREATEEAIQIISIHGGDIEPRGSTLYNNEQVTYLCFTDEFYEPCVNQRPLLVNHIENEVTEYIKPRIASCFLSLEAGLQGRYDITTSEELSIKTRLQSRNVLVNVDKEFNMRRNEISREFNHFEMHMPHPLYNFAEIATEIVNQEISYCNFDDLGFMILHPGYDIRYFIFGDSDIIYEIEEIASEQKFTFATRGCVIPAGL